jgi:hypothetical protein
MAEPMLGLPVQVVGNLIATPIRRMVTRQALASLGCRGQYRVSQNKQLKDSQAN